MAESKRTYIGRGREVPSEDLDDLTFARVVARRARTLGHKLQDMLGEYAGTVLLVSHDRDFLDRVVTSVIAAEGDGGWIAYAGGYSDMIAQRGRPLAAVAPAQKARPARASAPRPAVAARPRLSFKEKHALETLPARIEALEAEIAACRETLADGGLYARDPTRFEEAASRLKAAEISLAAAENPRCRPRRVCRAGCGLRARAERIDSGRRHRPTAAGATLLVSPASRRCCSVAAPRRDEHHRWPFPCPLSRSSHLSSTVDTVRAPRYQTTGS